MFKRILRGHPGQQSELGGVCTALCSFWIAFHATRNSRHPFTEGRSLWQYLFNGDGTLNIGAAQNIAIAHQKSTGNQISYFGTFLEKFDVHRQTTSPSGAPVSFDLQEYGKAFVQRFMPLITAFPGYSLIETRGQNHGGGKGHMMVAHVAKDGVRYLDPNYGEFRFPCVKSFETWFRYAMKYDSKHNRYIRVARFETRKQPRGMTRRMATRQTFRA